MSYTRKNISVITLLLTILIFICMYLLNSQIFLLVNSYYNNTNSLNSKVIPVNKTDKTLETIKISSNIQNSLIWYKNNNLKKHISNITENTHYKTQKQVLKANITNRWRIQIPKLGLDVHIEEGTTSNVLLKAVGHFENTAIWDGNVCLAGHNRGYLCNFFQKIKNLKIGDEIIYCTNQGKRVYKVKTNKIILETDLSYIEKTEDNRITLITCEENTPEYRRCLQAMQVAEYLNIT